jgi:dTMP kinase
VRRERPLWRSLKIAKSIIADGFMEGLFNMVGKFIVFEGIDGSGKSTQLRLLRDYLMQQDLAVLTTREPGGTPVGEKIRDILLDPQHSDLHYRTEALLYSSARSQLITTQIEPALAAGKMVLCDRFVDSTLAYQGYGRGLPLSFLQSLNQLATGGLEPDLVLIFDLPVEQGLKRVNRRSGTDRLEQEPLQFHQRVRQGYLTIAADRPESHVVLDASMSIEVLHRSVLKVVGGLLNAHL